jgi:ABC-type branched-subunit amino acid transport system ATPase component
MDPKGTTVLQISDVWKSFRDVRVLGGVSFEVATDCVTSLLGSNGAGKTTIFNLISGFLRPDRGSISLYHQAVSHASPYRVARMGVGRLFQDVRVFGELTILDNLLLGLSLPGESAVGALLTSWRGFAAQRRFRRVALDMLELVGLDVDPSRKASDLSYGQQKRLGLGRALMSSPRLLLLDEPTSGLDPMGVDEFVDLIRGLHSEHLTLLVIEHNRTVVERIADWVIFLDQGVVLREGPTKEVMADPELARRYLGQ